MTDRIRPALDDFQYSPETEQMLAIKAEERFLDETTEGKLYAEKYSSRDASDLLIGWCTANAGGLVTNKHLQLAFRELVADGILKPRPVKPEQAPQSAPKYSPPVIRPETAAEREIRTGDSGTSLADARKLSPIPKQKVDRDSTLKDVKNKKAPVSQELVDAARVSRLQRPGNQGIQGLPLQWAEARAVTALNHPEVALDSQRFNELVAQVISESSQ